MSGVRALQLRNARRPKMLSQAIAYHKASRYDTGALRDLSGRGHHATLVNDPTFTAGSPGYLTLASASSQYLEIADHPDLDFSAGDSWTVLVAMRYSGTATFAVMAKRDSFAASVADAGWLLRTQNTRVPLGLIDDATTARAAMYPGASVEDAIEVHGMRVRAGASFIGFTDGAGGATNQTLPSGTLANNKVLRIGATSNGAGLADMDYFGDAIFRRDLSPKEIELAGLELLAVRGN